mmetsp:Transcript_48127/g.145362  ORF Transcript_48127/g.145362 Transcript_48127/m.145362 type:complete len:105 (+) Transcript_48127:552-866(+)
MIRLTVTGRQANYNIIFDARETSQQLLLYACIANRVPEDRRVAMAQFVARANFGLVIGNFELDMTDGETRFKVTIDVEEGQLSCKWCRTCTRTHLQWSNATTLV